MTQTKMEEKRFLTKDDIPNYLKEEIVEDRILYIESRLKKHQKKLEEDLSKTIDHLEMFTEENEKASRRAWILAILTVVNVVFFLFSVYG